MVALNKWGYEALEFADGVEAWRAIEAGDAPELALLDWILPGMDGAEICRRVRADPRLRAMYLILVTVRGGQADIVEGLEAGADDYVSKPFDPAELRARLQAGVRIVDLESALRDRVRELEDALSHVRQLQGLISICSYCKKIRETEDYWQNLESYFSARSDATFSHGICPSCFETLSKVEMGRLTK